MPSMSLPCAVTGRTAVAVGFLSHLAPVLPALPRLDKPENPCVELAQQFRATLPPLGGTGTGASPP